MGSLEFFATHPVFTRQEFATSRERPRERSSRTTDSLLRRHAARGRIVRVRQGLYASVPPGGNPASLEVDPCLLATKAADDATVSHHAALQFHGRVYAMWNRVTFFTRRNTRPFRFGAMEFVPTKPRHSVAVFPNMGGYVDLVAHAGGHVRVTTCERALVDLLDTPKHGGSWEEIWRSLEMVEFFDLDAVISYTLLLETALTTARVGFFLEQHRERFFVTEQHLAKLTAHAPRQARYFDSTRETGQLVKRWQVIVPERVLNQTWEEDSI